MQKGKTNMLDKLEKVIQYMKSYSVLHSLHDWPKKALQRFFADKHINNRY